MEDDNRALGLVAAGAGIGLWWLLRKPSPNFSWAELTATGTGLPNEPTLEDRIRMIYAARKLLEPLRDAAGPLSVTSGFRSPAVNAAVNGAGGLDCTSFHCKGLGFDLYSADWDGEELASYLYGRTDLPIAEVVVYPNSPSGRIHVAADIDGAPGAREFLTYNGSTYSDWNIT
jgi:hypothetical protein